MKYVETLFLKILIMGITGSYVILAVFFFRFLIRKASKKFSYLLWISVAFRLICPISFSSIFSIFNLKKLFQIEKIENANNIISYIPSGKSFASNSKFSVDTIVANNYLNQTVSAAASSKAVISFSIFIYIAAIIWIIGALGLLFYSIVSLSHLNSRIAKAVIWKDNIFECDEVFSPFVLGLIRPRIYIPFLLNERERAFIIMHEQYHIKHLDHIVKFLSYLLLSVYWFNPLIWLAFIYMARDMEMRCDENVLKEMGYSIKKEYSMSLLTFASGYRFPVAGPLTFGKTGINSRIKNILQYKKQRWWMSLIFAIICIIAVSSLISNSLDTSKAADAHNSKETSIIQGMDFEKDINSESTTNNENNTAVTNNLTMEDVLAQHNWNSLTIDYFKKFGNAEFKSFDDVNALNANINFNLTYKEKPYELQVSYMKEDMSIQSILLVKKTDSDAILLYSDDSKFTTNTNVTAFLEKNITVSTFLTYHLPKPFVNGSYTASLSDGEGNLFFNSKTTPETVGSAPSEWYEPGGVVMLSNKDYMSYTTFKNGKLVSGNMHDNHTAYIGVPIILTKVQEQAVLMEVEHDLFTASEAETAKANGKPIPEDELTSKLWEIYFAREDSNKVYCIFLNEKDFSKKDAITFARSVKFTEKAFQ